MTINTNYTETSALESSKMMSENSTTDSNTEIPTIKPLDEIHEAVLTAIIVSESINEILKDDDDNFYTRMHENVGAAEMRSFAIKLVASVEIGYAAISEIFIEPFDLEFVPLFLHYAGQTLEENSGSISDIDSVRIGKEVARTFTDPVDLDS